MTVTYTGINGGGAYPNTITGPAAGEFVTEASVGLVAQGAANLAKRNYDRFNQVAYTDVVVGFNGRTSRTVARVAVADATPKVLGLAAGGGIDYAGKRFVLPGNPTGGPNVLTLNHSVVSPDEGETLEVVWITTGAFGGGTQYSIRREDATVIATLEGSAAAEVTAMNVWAEFEYVSGVWRLGASSGCAVDSAVALYGVVPGAGA